MFPASSKGGGQMVTTGPVDACKTPSPGGPVPLPYPNIAMGTQYSSGTLSSKVKIVNKETALENSEVSMSSGDEPGTVGGIMSNKFKGPLQMKSGSSKVKAEGKKIAHLTSMTGHNGSNANVPVGAQVAPSQVKVIVMP